MLLWNQLDASRASCRNQLCSNESTNCFYTLEFLLEWCGACDLRSPICPFHDIFLHCDRRQTYSCGTFRRGCTGRGYPRSSSSCISSWANSRCSTRDPLASSRNDERGVAFSLCSNWESRGDPWCIGQISCSPPFRFARSARTCSGRCRRPSMIDILCTVLWVPYRVVHTIRCSQLHGSFLLNLGWTDNMVDFVEGLVEERVDSGGSRFSESILCQSFLNRKININPKYRVLMFLPSTVQVLCTAWFIDVNLCRILMPFVPGINRQKEYCLSLTWILTSKYQSIVDDRMKIKSTSNMVNMLEESTLNYHIVL